MTRTDIHRPSLIKSEDYTHLHEFSTPPPTQFYPNPKMMNEWLASMEELYGTAKARSLYAADGVQIHGDEYQCDACGARYMYGSLFTHKSGEVISMGHDCASDLGLGYPIAQAKAMQTHRARMAKAARNRLARHAGLKAWAREQSEEVMQALKGTHHITESIRRKLIQYGESPRLSEAQKALVLKLWAAEQDIKVQDEELHVPVPVDGERITVTGTIVGHSLKETMYGEVYKLTIKVATPEGSWLVYGTEPRSVGEDLYAHNEERQAAWKEEEVARRAELGLDDHMPWDVTPERVGIKGLEITFTAKVSRGDRDPHFGFFSRPTKASLAFEDTATGTA